jgi:hypothetical protein
LSESVPTPPPRSYPLTSVVISLDHSFGCEGTCAQYRVELHGDGRIVYHGLAFVAEAGVREASIDPQEIVTLLTHLYDLNFFDMPEEFSSARVTQYRDGIVTAGGSAYGDVRPAILTVRIGDFEKRMVVSYSAPEEFGTLVPMIDMLAGTERWVR